MKISIEADAGDMFEEELKFGEIKLIPLGEREEVEATIQPARAFDVGEGPGKEIKKTITGGVVGVLLDARGRPLYLPEKEDDKKQLLLSWFKALDLYPEDKLQELV